MVSELSGLGFLALNSKRGSQVSLLAEASPESFQYYTDDRHWSWTALRNTFSIHDLKDLFKRYAQRIQNAYLNVYLMLQVFISVTYITSILVVNQDKIQIVIPEIVVHTIISATCLVIFCTAFNEQLFKSAPWTQILHSCIITVMIVTADLGLTLYFYIANGRIRTTSAFQTLIIIYFFLPLPRKYQSIIFGVTVSLSHLLVTGLLLYGNSQQVYKRILADFVYYFCGNMVGIYAQLINEVTIRRAFLDRRGHIKSTIKKNYEKGQEEQLLLSILPKHISIKVKDELVYAIQELEVSQIKQNKRKSFHYFHQNSHHNHNHHHHQNHHSKSSKNQFGVIHKKPFSDLFVERHNNVTILYADIVNFTPLTVKLKADELVETLNELFERFDEAAMARNCLRIKLLGDCYYCVSGLPVPTPNHAKNCIEFGLDMIEIIRDIRETLKVNLEMRIGVHSGNILSGIIGIYKWHFDIWSKDTLIANHMEQAGKPGRIHITKQTKQILEKEGNNEFKFTPDNGKSRDKYLAENNIDTFLIVTNKRRKSWSNGNLRRRHSNTDDLGGLESNGLSNGNKNTFNRRITPTNSGGIGIRRSRYNLSAARKSADSIIAVRGFQQRKSFLRRATDVNGESLQILRNMLSKVNDKMAKAIDDMPIRKTDQWCGGQNFGENINPLLLCFYTSTSEINYQTQPDPLFKFYIACSLFILICIGLIQGLIMPSEHIVLWVSFSLAFTFLVILLPHAWVSYLWNRIKDPYRELDRIPEPEIKIIKFFYRISNSITNTWSLRILIYISVAIVLSTFALIDVVECKNEDNDNFSDDCKNPWYFTYSCTLAILGIYGFFRIHFLLKLFIALSSLIAYSWTIFTFRAEVFSFDSGSSPAVPPEFSHIIYLIKIVLLLHFMDRQMEYINRLDYVWKKKLTHEHQEAARTHAINTILIYNILPMQIVEFDQALFNFMEIEKIKVIGSTYMAASGLEVHDTARFSTSSPRSQALEEDYLTILRERSGAIPYTNTEPDLEKRRKTLVSLVRFAATMMNCLEGINRDAFQEFQLRVGIDCGPVVAGVIGTSKPHYDIWGDCVNMASRMDTTGVPGKIQIAKNSANLLMQAGVKCEFRDRIKVKGKHQLTPTYFVSLTEDNNLQFDDKGKNEPQQEITRL